jgi:hypothetical protein
VSPCYLVLRTGQEPAAPAAFQELCPSGIASTEQLAIDEGANTGGYYAVGPCDLAGEAYPP